MDCQFVNNAKNNGTAFFTVVYPAVVDYLDDFFTSLENQSEKSFDVVVFNDGLADFDFGKYDLPVTVVNCSGAPVAIRVQGIRYLIEEGYEFAIFGDSDDYFDPNRVEQSKMSLVQYDIAVNDLTLVDQSGRTIIANYLAQRIEHLAVIDFDFIADCNVFGLSNTAIRLSIIDNLSCPSELIAFDWFFYSRLLKAGASAVFSHQGMTYYRQHGTNIAGFQEVTTQKALDGIRCKMLHYLALSNGCPELAKVGNAYRELLQALRNDESQCSDYLATITTNKKNFPFWWEDIVLPSEYL